MDASAVLPANELASVLPEAQQQREPARRERRRAKREPISGSLTVLWGANAQEERVSQARLVDVSARGAKFRLAERVPAGSWLMFNHHPVGISGRGTVRYCRMVKSGYEVGVEFAGGTGWETASLRFAAQLLNLGAAVGTRA